MKAKPLVPNNHVVVKVVSPLEVDEKKENNLEMVNDVKAKP